MARVNSTITVKLLTRLALLLAITLAAQSLRLPPPVTGPLVNFMLILSTALVGTAAGISIGLLTPWAALLLGVIPPPLAPAVPFIMGGNALYCFTFGLLAQKGRAGAVLGGATGALLKFILIAGAARYLLALPAPLVEVLLLPQLFNALAGAAFAVPAAHYLQRILPSSLKR